MHHDEVLYYGVVGARAADRATLVGPGARRGSQAAEAPAAPREAGRARQRLWAELMARTFGSDVLACPRCGRRLRLIAMIEDARVVARMLRHLGMPTDVLMSRPARPPPDTSWCAARALDMGDSAEFSPAS
jgi:hypothetical protein